MTFFIILVIVVCIIAVVYITSNSPSHEEVQRQLAGIDDSQLIIEAERIALRVEVMIQSEIVGDDKTHQAVLDNNYDGPWPELRADGAYLSLYDNLRILKIAGINYCDRINRYKGQCVCALVPDSKNEFDHNAIKIVAEDGHKIGFIQSHQTDFVRSLTNEHFPYRCLAYIQELTDEDDGHKFYDGRIYIKKAE